MKPTLRFIRVALIALALYADNPFAHSPVPVSIPRTVAVAPVWTPTFETPVGCGPYDPRTFSFTTWLPNPYYFASSETAAHVMALFGAAYVLETDGIAAGSPYSVISAPPCGQNNQATVKMRILVFPKGTKIPSSKWYFFWGGVTLSQDLQVNAGQLALPYLTSPEDQFPGLARDQALAYLRLAAKEAQ